MSIITQKQGTLEYLTAEGISAPHCFTTRLGGVSTGYLSSMNIGMHRGDDPENVVKNYEILANSSELSAIIILSQNHIKVNMPTY